MIFFLDLLYFLLLRDDGFPLPPLHAFFIFFCRGGYVGIDAAGCPDLMGWRGEGGAQRSVLAGPTPAIPCKARAMRCTARAFFFWQGHARGPGLRGFFFLAGARVARYVYRETSLDLVASIL